MANKFKKIDREYLLTDSSVNCYGFRLMTSGYLMDEFKKNPIGYHMHDRNGVLLKWEDLRAEGDKVYGKPVINLSHSRGQQTVDEVENGFLNGASVGHLQVIELSDNPALKLPGQEGPTVTKWFNRECSLVDIPGNYNGLAKLYDNQGQEINLADFSKPKIPLTTMKQLQLTAAMLAALSLSADSTEAEFTTKFNDLVAKANKADQLQKDLSDLQATVTKKSVSDLLDHALNVDKKITKEVSDKLAADYATNPEGLKTLLSAMPSHVSIAKQLSADGAKGKYEGKSWDDLHLSGELADVKKNLPDLYAELFEKKYGRKPNV